MRNNSCKYGYIPVPCKRLTMPKIYFKDVCFETRWNFDCFRVFFRFVFPTCRKLATSWRKLPTSSPSCAMMGELIEDTWLMEAQNCWKLFMSQCHSCQGYKRRCWNSIKLWANHWVSRFFFHTTVSFNFFIDSTGGHIVVVWNINLRSIATSTESLLRIWGIRSIYSTQVLRNSCLYECCMLKNRI